MKDKSTINLALDKSLAEITTYQAGAAQASVHRALQKACDDYLKQFGITKMQWLIIGQVLDAGDDGVRITEIAETLNTTLSYLTTTINLLESKNILTRRSHPTDSRAKVVTINSAFAPTCNVIEKTLRKKLRETVYAQVSPEDFRIYMKVMYQLSTLGK